MYRSKIELMYYLDGLMEQSLSNNHTCGIRKFIGNGGVPFLKIIPT